MHKESAVILNEWKMQNERCEGIVQSLSFGWFVFLVHLLNLVIQFGFCSLQCKTNYLYELIICVMNAI